MDAAGIIERLGLERLPIEGGYFKRSYRSSESLAPGALPWRYAGVRPLGSAIYYLLSAAHDAASMLHKLPADEIYHFYLGDPVDALLLHPGGRVEHAVLGPDLANGQQVQLTVPHGVWQGLRLRAGGRFALMGATMAPGYDPADYQGGVREALVQQYPDCAELIHALTPA
jgi:predicted cupin superfamily sugar epimerase